MLNELLRNVAQGTPGCMDVLHDWLLEQGLPQHSVAALTHSLMFGTVEESVDFFAKQTPRRVFGPVTSARYIRPFGFFDTVNVGPVARGRFEFFRDLMDKRETETNCVMPRRLPAGSDMQVKRISISEAPPAGSLLMRFNRRVVLDMNAQELARFGPYGYPIDMGLSDRDDLYLSFFTGEPAPHERARPVRCTLHGWLSEPLD